MSSFILHHETQSFCDSLRWVRLEMRQVSSTNRHHTIPIWWPALVYGYDQLQITNRSATLEFKSYLHIKRKVNNEEKYAQLLGEKLPPGMSRNFPIPKDKLDTIVIPYFNHFDEMEDQYENHLDWRDAVDFVNKAICKEKEYGNDQSMEVNDDYREKNDPINSIHSSPGLADYEGNSICESSSPFDPSKACSELVNEFESTLTEERTVTRDIAHEVSPDKKAHLRNKTRDVKQPRQSRKRIKIPQEVVCTQRITRSTQKVIDTIPDVSTRKRMKQRSRDVVGSDDSSKAPNKVEKKKARTAKARRKRSNADENDNSGHAINIESSHETCRGGLSKRARTQTNEVVDTHVDRECVKEREVETASTRSSSSREVTLQETGAQIGKPMSLEEKFKECLGSLCPQIQSAEYIFDGSTTSSNFNHFKEDLTSFLTESIRSYKDGAGQPSALYLFGRPGTGKTTMVKHCIDQVHPDKSLFINSAHLCSTKSFIQELVKGIGKNLPSKNDNSLEYIEKRLSTRRGTIIDPFILVLDEIDMVLGKKMEDHVLKKVFNWGLDPKFPLILIGISNAVGNNYAKRLRQHGRFKEIVVQPYSEKELAEIIKRRLGSNIDVVQDIALTFICRKVSKRSGDARKVLDLMSSALKECKEDFSKRELSTIIGDQTGGIVKLHHVTKAIRNSGSLVHAEIIESLPQAQKCVLCIVVTLIEVIASDDLNNDCLEETSISLGVIKSCCAQAAMNGIMPSDCSVLELIQGLQDSGLLRARNESDAPFSDNSGILLGIDMEEIECTLDETLYKEPSFYVRLRDHVKKNGMAF